ncbi:hypothetical protein FIBSPDRAFT_572641 [Athelia psychrophila]|uniref:Uncharacterized protein n=1 Tax=Athelia psychrophila TaxID=1759441 RepID=A0A166HMV7_9AGAM|nr:hypothetical protein FIBSPDRAFT_572641 [Fibularhizoctonia sp. CBS 109695]
MGFLLARARLGGKSAPQDVHGPDFRVIVTQNRLSSDGLGTCDELKVVLVQYPAKATWGPVLGQGRQRRLEGEIQLSSRIEASLAYDENYSASASATVHHPSGLHSDSGDAAVQSRPVCLPISQFQAPRNMWEACLVGACGNHQCLRRGTESKTASPSRSQPTHH